MTLKTNVPLESISDWRTSKRSIEILTSPAYLGLLIVGYL